MIGPTVEFFDPHPGFGGAAVPLPDRVKIAADELAGKRLPVEAALAVFKVALAKMPPGYEVKDTQSECLMLRYKPTGASFPQHVWRVIRYRPVPEEAAR
jgi:hypothetical protein